MPSEAPSADELRAAGAKLDAQPIPSDLSPALETLEDILTRQAREEPVLSLVDAVRAAEGARKVKVLSDRKARTRNLLMGLSIEAPKARVQDLPDHLHQPRAVGKR